ncbi:unnamed protein product, partial [Aureobasidium pullulans]
ADSSSVETPARSSSPYHGVQATSSPNEAIARMNLNPHEYTSGRWLHRNKEQTEARYIQFDYDALCRKAVEQCPGSQSVAECKKIEGGSNRVFLFTMDDEQTLIARLPFSLAGPSRLVIHSEVAAIAYKIVCWCDDSSNPIGTEYILMRPVPGVQLHGRWETMTSSEHLSCIESISKLMAQVAELEFLAYGNIPIPARMKRDFADGFCVGPHCGSTYWNCAPGEASIYRQMRPDLFSYCKSLVASARSRIPASAPEDQLPYRGSIQEHVKFVTDCEAVLYDLIKEPQLCAEAFEVWMKGYVPAISQARAVNDTILRPFRHCNTSWRDSVVAVRSDLIDLARGWNALGLAGSCPYQPTQDQRGR